MDDFEADIRRAELKLRCLEMAVAQAHRICATDFECTVANLTTWFYNRITTEQPVSINPMPTAAKGKKPTGQAPHIFE